MTVLEEVPGAGERPGSSHIVVERADDGAQSTIVIPPRPLPFVVGAGAVVLLVNLLAVLWMGVMLFFGHVSVGIMTEIAPRDLPAPLRAYSFPLFLGWLALEGLGAASLLALVRPAFARERLAFTADGVNWERAGFGRHVEKRFGRAERPHFALKRDPQGLTASVLRLDGADSSVEVAEHATEAEREWLLSVGNALLRRI